MDEEILEKRDYGKEFEEEVKTFLEETLKLSDVKGGPDFHIAPEGKTNQIDAAGRFGEILFVFECKASGRKIKKDLRKDILATSTKSQMVFENYKRIPEYSNCKLLRFIFITKRIEIPETQKELCKSRHIFYEEQGLLEYYTELHEKIGKYATYNFLSDFGIYPPRGERLKVTALRAKIGEHTVYSFYVHPRELLKFAYVARRRVGKEDFYQRMLDTSRIRKIQKFLDSGGAFPTNIIISLRDGKTSFRNFESASSNDTDVGTLEIEESYSACWIIDGQHRLYSFAKSTSNELVSCIAFDEIKIEKERSFFLEINREQKPIQPDLLWDLEGLANSNSPKGIISNIVHSLNKIEDGPFFYKIYIPLYGTKADKIVNMAAFCNGIENASLTKQIAPNFLGIANPLATGQSHTITKRIAQTLSRYFTLLKEDLAAEHQEFALGNAGVPIMLYLLEPIVAHVRRVPNFEDLGRYTPIIASFFTEHYSSSSDLKKLKTETNSEGARKNLAREIGIRIRRELRDSTFWPEMEQDEFVESIKIMERRIANLISSKLSEITTGWEKQRVPHIIYLKAKERMESDGTRFDENFGLGDEMNIIIQRNNWDEVFSSIFINKNGFSNQDELRLAFSYLSKIRNPAAHGKYIIHSKEDLDQCEIYLKRFSRVVPEAVPEYSPATGG